MDYATAPIMMYLPTTKPAQPGQLWLANGSPSVTPLAPTSTIQQRPAATDGPATLPSNTLPVDYPAVTGRTIKVRPDGDLQAAINDASLGDEIVLHAASAYTGNFTLPPKSGSGWLVIRSDGLLPAPGARAKATDAGQMAKVQMSGRSGGDRVFSTLPGAHNYRLVGLEITNSAKSAQTSGLVDFGDGSADQTSNPAHDLILDRSYVHPQAGTTVIRGVVLNSGAAAVIDSTAIGFVSTGRDTQAIAGWNGTGPYLIQDDDLMAAGEVVMFGGADPKTTGQVPADITLRKSHLHKDPAWLTQGYSVKNLFELKMGKRVLVEDNVMENTWDSSAATPPAAGQPYALNIKSANQDGTAPWSETSNLTIRRNVIRNSGAGFAISGAPQGLAVPVSNVSMHDNIFDGIGRYLINGGGDGHFITILGNPANVSIKNNTMLGNVSTGILLNLDPGEMPGATDFVFQNNIVPLGDYGVKCSGVASGEPSLWAMFGKWAFSGNVLIGNAKGANYPAGNTIVSSIASVGLTSPNNYSLAAGSPALTAGIGGTRAGADVAAVLAATAGE